MRQSYVTYLLILSLPLLLLQGAEIVLYSRMTIPNPQELNLLITKYSKHSIFQMAISKKS